MNNELANRIWANRRQQSAALAKASLRRDLPVIELEPEEWELLRRADALANEIRKAEEKSK